jgi:hypothetical protein
MSVRAKHQFLAAWVEMELAADQWAAHVFELPIQLSWIMIYFWVLYDNTQPQQSWQASSVMMNTFVGAESAFAAVGNAGDVFTWIDSTLAPTALQFTDYTGNAVDSDEMRFQEFNLVMGGIWVRQTRSKVTSCGSNEDEWNWKPPPPPLPGSTESTETATAAGCYPPEELDDEVPYDYPSADFSNATFSAYLLQAGFVQDPLRYHSSPHRQKAPPLRAAPLT